MAKVKRVNNQDGTEYGYSFHCLGCKCIHVVPVSGKLIWGFNGSLDKPTFTPSLKVTGCNFVHGEDKEYCGVCHSIISDGRIMFCDDCDHALKGQTVEMAEVKDDDQSLES